jgi:hypothetical protein
METNGTVASTLFTRVPQEIRDEIYSYLIDYHTVTYPSTRKLWSKPFATGSYGRRIIKNEDNYMDSRVTLPIKPSLRPLQVCHQMREEFKQYAHMKMRKSNGPEIQMHVLAPTRGSTGSFVPDRTELSPTFVHHKHFFESSKEVNLEIWPGDSWWNGEKSVTMNNAIAEILSHFPEAESVNIDILLHMWEFYNWNLPLQGTAHRVNINEFTNASFRRPNGEPYKSVKREMKIPHDPEGSLTDICFYSKEETYNDADGEIHIMEQICTVSHSFRLNRL